MTSVHSSTAKSPGQHRLLVPMPPPPTAREGNARTRVLIVVHDSGVSGAQRVMLTLLHGLDRSRFECHVVAPYDGPFLTEVRGLGHEVHIRHLVRWVPSAARVAKTGRIRYLGAFVNGLRSRAQSVAALVERLGVRVVLTNTVTCIEGALAARMAGVPHVWHIHESISGNPDLRGVLPAFVYQGVIDALSLEVAFVSNSVAENYGKLRKRGRVVHPGLPLPRQPDRASARSRLLERTGFPDDAKLVGVVAALQPSKDHATFLTAARLVRERRPDTCFVIVGAGNAACTAAVVDKADELGLTQCTRLLGRLPPSEIHELMAGLDVLVISSVQESFGLTAIEALAVETPVVATRCGGPSEIIRDGIDGRLVEVRDAPAMATAVDMMLADPATARTQARAGRQRVELLFGQEAYVSAMEDILATAIAAGDSGAATGLAARR